MVKFISGLIGDDTVQSNRWLPMFRRNILPPSFGLKFCPEIEDNLFLKNFCNYMHLEDHNVNIVL